MALLHFRVGKKANTESKILYICKKIATGLYSELAQHGEFELFVQIQAGDKVAFDSLFRTYYQYLCNYAFQILKEIEASEEVVQEVFVNVWEKRDSLDIHTSPKSYLFRSVHNRCLNQIKHIDVREKYKTHNERILKHAETESSIDAEKNELAVLIQKSVDELPTERKRIFQLSRNKGLKNKEIAEQLGISIKTVENQMGKALKYLRLQLSDYLCLAIVAGTWGIIFHIIIGGAGS